MYNNDSLVKRGVSDFKIYRSRTYALTEVKAIGKLADEIADNFKKGNKDESLNYFNKTLKRSLTCHRVVRKW